MTQNFSIERIFIDIRGSVTALVVNLLYGLQLSNGWGPPHYVCSAEDGWMDYEKESIASIYCIYDIFFLRDSDTTKKRPLGLY